MKQWLPRIGKLLNDAFAPIFGTLIALWILWNVETRLFPIVSNFQVQSLSRSAVNEITVTGVLTKHRSCELITLSVYRKPLNKPLVLLGQYKKEIFGSDAGTGIQTWGPVTLKFPSDIGHLENIKVIALHRCHAFWLQESEYATFLYGALSNLPVPK